MTDFLFMDKIAELMKEQRVPRLLYKKGVCAEGTFFPYMDLSEYTKASFLRDIDSEVPVTVRFAKVFDAQGSSDTARDVTGMFVRFFTDQGKFDLISHNVPIDEKLRTPEKMMKLIIAFKKREESFNLDDKELWKLAAEEPVYINFLLEYFSDNTTVRSYRYMRSFSMNSYAFEDMKGQKRKVTFAWSPILGRKNISRQEAEFLAGYDRNAAARDLVDAICDKRYPEYNLEAYIEGEEPLTIGKVRITEMAESCTSEEISYTPVNVPCGIQLEEGEFNRFTAFAFNESARMRGGNR